MMAANEWPKCYFQSTQNDRIIAKRIQKTLCVLTLINRRLFRDLGLHTLVNQVDVIQKRFEVKYLLFTKRLQYFKYEQGKG